MSAATPTRKSLWGWGVVAITGGFVLFLGVLALVAINQDYDLVDEDYYARELAYQQRLEQINRTDSLLARPQLSFDGASGILTVRGLSAREMMDKPGSIRLYRPSDAELDQVFNLVPDSTGRQSLQTGTLAPGLWRVQIEWWQDGHGYYHEQSLVIGG